MPPRFATREPARARQAVGEPMAKSKQPTKRARKHRYRRLLQRARRGSKPPSDVKVGAANAATDFRAALAHPTLWRERAKHDELTDES